MAAEYGININVRTKDEQLVKLQKNLTLADKKVKSLTKELDQLSKKTGKGPGSGGPFSNAAIAKTKELADATKLAQHNFEKYTRGLLNSESANRKGIVSTRELATRMKDVAASVGITNEKFALFTAGFTKLNFSAQLKSLQRFNESAKITASTFGAMGSKNVPGVTGFSNADISTLLNFAPANTISAIERYLDTLTGVRKQLDISEKEYKDVTGRIKEMNKALEEQRNLLRENTKEGKISRQMRSEARDIRQRIAESPGGRFRRFQRNRTAEDRRIRKQVQSSAIIGGAFPLLFGQGLGASAGGFLGGAGGGLMGGQMGFALSLLGTQIGAFIDGLGKKATELGDALRKPSENIEILVQRAGISGTALERQISKLEELGLQATAADIALAEIDEFADVEQLKKLSKSFQELGNIFAKLNTQLLSFVSQGLGDFAAKLNEILQSISGAFTLADIANEIPKSSRADFQKRIGELIPESRARSPLDFFDPLRKGNLGRALQLDSNAVTPEILQQLRKEFVPSSAPAKVQISQELLDSARSVKIDNLKSEIELEAKRLTQRSEEQDVIRKTNEVRAIESKIALKKFELDKTEEGVRKDKLADQLEELRLQRKLNIAQLRNAEILASPLASAIVDVDKRLEALMDTQKQIVELSKTIESSFSESFKGIIKGTMSVQDAFRNMFMKIADHFLDMAAQMAAAQISRGFMGLFSNLIPFNFGNDIQGPAPGFSATAFAANGGPVGMRKPYIVGERGPELFVPNQSGNIIPNHDLGGIGGGMNIVVNVDASGSNVEGDEDQGRELGRLISVAVQSEILQQQRPGGLLA